MNGMRIRGCVAWAVLGIGVAAVVLGGCRRDRKGTAIEAEPAGSAAPAKVGASDSGGGGQADPYAARRTPAARQDCPLDEEVRNPPAGSPEAVVAALYEAAIAPDADAAFDRFYAQFGPGHARAWVRDQYWPRIRKHVDKYLTGRNPVAFRICRRVQSGDDAVKLFIRSYDSRKSDPPITLRKHEGQWKVDFFTP